MSIPFIAKPGRGITFSLCLFFLFSILAVPAVYANEYNFPGGVKEPDEKTRLWAEKNITRISSETTIQSHDVPVLQPHASIPSRVINIEYLPKVGRQVHGACTAWATTYYHKTWQEAKEHNWVRPDPAITPERVMSPAFTYNLSNGGVDEGSSFEMNYGYLEKYGAVGCDVMDANASPGWIPSSEQIISAFPYRAQELFQINLYTAAELQLLKEHLASGDLATTSLTIYSNFHSYPAGEGIDSEVYYKISGNAYTDWCNVPPCPALHALAIIGYDDNKTYTDNEGVVHTGAVLLVNSWGNGWGLYLEEAEEGGFIWVGYDFLLALKHNVYWMSDRIGYVPTLIGTYELFHPRQGELSIDLLAGDKDAPDWSMDVSLLLNDIPRSINQTIAFDATDYASLINYSWWLRVRDMDIPGLWSPPETGAISSFTIKRLDGKIWEAEDVPMDTVDFNASDPATSYSYLNIALVQPSETDFDDMSPASSSHVWADLDRDTDMDLLFFENSGECRILMNNGNGNLQEVGCTLPELGGVDIAIADVNGDGLADITCNGYNDGTPGTWIYFNAGNFIFYDSGIELPPSYGTLQWLDYNRDTRLDLSLNIKSDTGDAVDVLLQNVDGSFQRAELGLPGAKHFGWTDYNRDGMDDIAVGRQLYYQSNNTLTPAQSISQSGFDSWIDVDNDGWMDLAMTGQNNSSGVIWRNNQDGTFSKFVSITDDYFMGGGTWGDLDNDGLSDYAVWADYLTDAGVADINVKTQVWRNRGNSPFQNLGFDFTPVSLLYQNEKFPRVQWVDYDGDFDLDLSIAGPGYRDDGFLRKFSLYDNKTAQVEGLDKPNTPPQPPTILNSELLQDGSIVLSWNSGSDAETSSTGLHYNLRIGRNPETGDILPQDFNAPGTGHLFRPTLTDNQLGVKFKSVPAAAFYWSVQSVDTGYARSDWTEPQIFSMPGVSLPGDLNDDNKIDVADIIKVARMAQGLETPQPAVADRNGDAQVDSRDVALLENVLLGINSSGQNIIAEQSIGPAGGTLSAQDFLLTVPAGAFSELTDLSLQARETDRPFGDDQLAAMFSINGLPETLYKSLTIRLHAEESPSKDVYVVTGGNVLPKGSTTIVRSHVQQPTKNLGNDWYEVTISASNTELSAQQVSMSNSIQAMEDSSTITPVQVGTEVTLTQGWWTIYDSPHFRFYVARNKLTSAQLSELGGAFEDAYTTLTSPPYSFKCAFAPGNNNRLPVYVKSLKPGKYGEQISGKFSDLAGYIEINIDKISEVREMRQSAMHEFFHYIQDQYNPESGLIKSIYGSTFIMLAEASSVWSEELSDNPVLPSKVFSENVWESVVAGVHAGTIGTSSLRAAKGYGNAGLIKYLVDQPTGFSIRRLWEDIALGMDALPALFLQTPNVSAWWGDYASKLTTGKLYPLPYSEAVSIGKKRFIVKDQHYLNERLEGAIHFSLPDFSANRAKLLFNATSKPLLDASHTLSCKLTRPSGDLSDLQLFLLKYKDAGEDVLHGEIIGEGVEANGSLKFDVPNIKAIVDANETIVPLIVNRNGTVPYDGKIEADFIMAVTHDTPKTLEEFEAPGWKTYGGAPVIKTAGEISGKGWSRFKQQNIPTESYRKLPFLVLNMPGQTPSDMDITYAAEITTDSTVTGPDQFGLTTVWHVPTITTHTLKQSLHYGLEEDFVTIGDQHSIDGHFSITVPDDVIAVSGIINVVYDVTETKYDSDNNQFSQTTHSDVEMAILAFFIFP